MPGSPLTRLRALLALQAAVTAGSAFVGPLDVDRWLPFVIGVAAGALVLAWFVGTENRSAWAMTLGLEVLALVVGGTGAANGYWVPGTVVGLVVGVLLLLPSGRGAFAAAPVKVLPVRLTPPPVMAAPRSAPPAFPPPGIIVAASAPPMLPPPPPMPPVPQGFSGSILPGR